MDLSFHRVKNNLSKPGILHVYCTCTNRSLFISSDNLLETLLDVLDKLYNFKCNNAEIMTDLKKYGAGSFIFNFPERGGPFHDTEFRLKKLIEIKTDWTGPLYKSFEL